MPRRTWVATSWTEGACAVQFCQDVAGWINECDFVLGIAVVGGVCTTVSGCDCGQWRGLAALRFFKTNPHAPCARGSAQCDLQSVSSEDGMWYNFTAVGAPQGAEILWYIDDFFGPNGRLKFSGRVRLQPQLERVCPIRQ